MLCGLINILKIHLVNELMTKATFSQLPYKNNLQIIKTDKPQPSLREPKNE